MKVIDLKKLNDMLVTTHKINDFNRVGRGDETNIELEYIAIEKYKKGSFVNYAPEDINTVLLNIKDTFQDYDKLMSIKDILRYTLQNNSSMLENITPNVLEKLVNNNEYFNLTGKDDYSGEVFKNMPDSLKNRESVLEKITFSYYYQKEDFTKDFFENNDLMKAFFSKDRNYVIGKPEFENFVNSSQGEEVLKKHLNYYMFIDLNKLDTIPKEYIAKFPEKFDSLPEKHKTLENLSIAIDNHKNLYRFSGMYDTRVFDTPFYNDLPTETKYQLREQINNSLGNIETENNKLDGLFSADISKLKEEYQELFTSIDNNPDIQKLISKINELTESINGLDSMNNQTEDHKHVKIEFESYLEECKNDLSNIFKEMDEVKKEDLSRSDLL